MTARWRPTSGRGRTGRSATATTPTSPTISLIAQGPTQHELDQAQNALEASTLRQLENVDAKADQLNYYYYYTGQPDFLAQDLARTRAVTAADVQRVARQYLQAPRVVLSVVPQGHRELAAGRPGPTLTFDK